ncbi:MAG: hypothetical protein ACLQGP_11310 [Isosphaeraceae bacterium]
MFDPECNDLDVRDASVATAPDFGANAAQAFVEEKGAAGIITKKRGDRSIVPE